MIRITVGEVYTAERARSGSSAHGNWELLVVKDNRDEMTLWVTNVGTGIADGDQFRVKSIESFDKKRVPYKDGKLCRDRSDRSVEWRLECSANVTVEPVGFSQMPDNFSDVPFKFDDLPPFEVGENPFENNELPL